MIIVTTDKNPLMTKNTVVSNALPDSTLWSLKMFVLVRKSRQHGKVSKSFYKLLRFGDREFT